MEINLNQTIQTLQINGIDFFCDTADLESIRILKKFDEEFNEAREFDTAFLARCKEVIDVVLGEESYATLFSKESLKPYYLIQKLKEVFMQGINDFVVDNSRKELSEIQEYVNTIDKMTNTMERIADYEEKFHIS